MARDRSAYYLANRDRIRARVRARLEAIYADPVRHAELKRYHREYRRRARAAALAELQALRSERARC